MIEYPKSEQEEDASGCESGKKKKNENEKETELMKKEEDSAGMDTPVEDDLSLHDESSENEEDISEGKNVVIQNFVESVFCSPE